MCVMYTVFNDETEQYQLVEEPDPSLTYTYADYLQWNFEERLELIKGRIFKMSPGPNLKHQQVSGVISGEIYGFLKGKPCKSFSAPFDVRLPVKNKKKDHEVTTVVQPDIFVVCDLSKLDSRSCCGAPDLVVEILSPGNSKKDVRIKFELYEEAGVKEYWIVHPVEETIVVHVLNAEGKFEGLKMYTADDVLQSTAIKGFTIEVNEIFSE